jgi:hypothetical protein
MQRRKLISGLLFAPAIIRTPGLLMPIRPLLWKNPCGLPETELAMALQIVNNAYEKLVAQLLADARIWGEGPMGIGPNGPEILWRAATQGGGR